MNWLAGITVWLIVLAGVFALLWRFCKVSERLRTDSRVCDMAQRQRDAEGADFPYDPDDGYETDDYYGGGWAA